MTADLLLLVFFAGTFLIVLPAVIAEVRECHRRGRARVMRGASWQPRGCVHLSRLDVLDGIRCRCGA